MNINKINAEVKEACLAHDLSRTLQALTIAIPASEHLKDHPEYNDLQEVIVAATIWAKTISHQVDNVGKLMVALANQSKTDGYPSLATATLFINEVNRLKKNTKWDSINPDFCTSVDYIYEILKSYVDSNMEEGEA